MLVDLRQGPDVAETDVCIVGGGTVGLALAADLASSGRDVLVLESGGAERSDDADALNEAENVGSLPMDLSASRTRALGGASLLWAGQCVRLDPEDHEPRPWVEQSGWPLKPADLAAAYRRAERLMGVEGETYDERTWSRFGLSPPPLDPARLRTRMTVYAPEVSLAALTRRTLAAAPNVRVATEATVTGLDVDDDAVNGVRLAGGTLVRPRHVVLAAGGIENARLLLLDGFAEHRDAVGRYLQDLPIRLLPTVGDDAWSYLQDRYGLLYRRRRRYYPRLILSPETQAREEVLGCAGVLVFDHPAGSATARAKALVRSRRAGRADVREALRVAPGLAAVAARRYGRGLSPGERPERIRLQAFLEQAPDPASRVTLSDRRDAHGIPLPRVDWRVDERVLRTARVMVDTVDAELRRLQLGSAVPEPWLVQEDLTGLRDQFHHIGTTRMGTDPATSVVDTDGRVHGTRNLYVAGSSVFPTSSWANPTLTALALTLRLGEHLRGRAQT